ncbi:hypothetical protein FBU59_002729 [Linderina macrospora]|uniref:Uncharacterized protein n=1 Tax=Linderina macrospora TaxID=4868 RepID=A0ACC1JAB4_9FUNG|nr:hypothetical protein FBU59_002729 [Linderina macrospora]
MPWQNLESVIIEWFSGTADDHRRIAQIVRRYAPNVSEVYVRDKALTVSEMMPLVWGAGQQVGGRCARIQRLAICPYGYDQQWAHLLPNESGAASMIANRPSQFTSLAVGGADFTPELVTALQTQRRLRKLTIEHAWIESLSIAAAQGVCLPSITSLHLEHIIVSRHDTALPVSPRMFPNLQRLSVRHVWQHVDARTPGGSRGAISLQNEHWLQTVWNGYWPELQELSLPAISDLDATKLPESCPNLTRLTTNSLDYAGPRLSAHGLVSVLRGLRHLHFLSIEQRSSQGAPGYEIHDSALCRLIGSTDVLSSRRWSAATVRAGLIGPIPSPALSAVSTGSDTDVELDDFEMLPPQSNCLSASLNTLILPRASFTASTLDTLVRQLPGLVRLSASLRSEAFFGFAKPKQSLASAQNNVKWIGLSADEDVLTDAMELSAWIEQRFPSLQECSTNYARSHRTVINSLKTALPNVAFTRLNSSALQAICS